MKRHPPAIASSRNGRPAAPSPARRRSPCVSRRGVLLLVVLSMLTLFLMLGAAYLVAATRAREAARAYARLTLGSDDARVPHAQLLDSVLLRVVRGPAITGAVGGATISFESLLADKYGATAVSGTASSVSLSGSGPIVTVNATLFGSLQPTDLNGRVLTFAVAGRQATSHRIVRAQAGTGPNPDTTNTAATAFRLALDTPVTAGSFPVPAAGRIIINQREFIGDGSAGSPNEPWDGFDSANPFLARTGTMTISTSTVSRISYLPTLATTTLSGTWDYDSDGIPDAADNDNDGSWDGAFLDFGLPDMFDGNGNAIRLRASVLILDLDGRFNVNAHDSMARIAYSGTVLWSSTTGTSLPLGSGYGPAEVNGAKMFSIVSSTLENPTLLAMVGGSTIRLTGTRGFGSRFTQSGSTPRLDAVEGRYGRDFATLTWPSALPLTTGTTLFGLGYSLPGVSGTNDRASRVNDRRTDDNQLSDFGYGVPTVWWTGGTAAFNWAASPSIAGAQPPPRGVFNSPPDLHGRMRTTTLAAVGSAIAPQLVFGKPEWSGASASFESTDDPYEINLDTRGGRGGWLHDPATSGVGGSASFADNPFLLSELEPVLRPYDSDTNRLAMRLAAILGSFAEESRMKVTTDSWDTTAITGSAAQLIYGGTAGGGWLQAASGAPIYGSTPTSGIIGGEIARGERFDLNRALLASGTDTAGYVPSGPYYTQRQAYFKDLYTLLVMISSTGGSGPTALTPTGTVTGTAATAALAQYAANVVEFRDADSVMTPFEYDTNPSNGWDVDGDVRTNDAGSNERRVAFGAERPEILIQQAFAWRDSVSGSAGMVITLHRPWNARALTITPTTAAIDAEPCDYALDTLVSSTNSTIITGTAGVPNNLVDLGKKPHSQIMTGTANTQFNDTSQANYPIWRIRIVSGTEARYVRFDTNSPATGEFAPTITTGASKPRLGPDSTLTFASGTTITLTATNSVTGTVTGTAFLNVTSTTITGMRVPGTSGSATISLERLSDPSQQPGNTVWATGTADPRAAMGTTTVPLQYVVVDSCTIPVVETSAAGLTPPTVTGSACMRSTTSATAAFWATGSTAAIGTITSAGTLTLPTSLASGNTVWFPWPNRPLVGSPELLLVPRFDSLGMLQNYQRPTVSNQAAVGIPVPANLLFDAVHVPTRFAGIHRTYTTDFSAATGIFNTTTPVNQLSSFRDPGRVNLNTVGFDDVWDAAVNGPLSGTIASRNSVNLISTPARSMVNLLSLSSSGTTVVSDTDSALATGTGLNPMHAIYTATRLGNTVTPRSNVFAVWITLRESTANDPDSVRYRRAFYIIDRSIPVGYEEGRDHNVRDAIRLRRIIE